MKSFPAFLLLLSVSFSAAIAQSIPTKDASARKWELTPALSYAQTAYEFGDVSRLALGLEVARSGGIFGRPIRLSANFQWALAVENDVLKSTPLWEGEGDGYALDLTARIAPLTAHPNVAVYVRAFYLAEDYGGHSLLNGSAEGDALGFSFGADYTWKIRPAFDLFAGIDLTAYEDGTYQRSINSLSLPDQDMKHDNPLGLRVGGIYDFDSFRLKATLALISEQSLHLGAGFRF
jgi:opacity protein-like surface antigen